MKKNNSSKKLVCTVFTLLAVVLFENIIMADNASNFNNSRRLMDTLKIKMENNEMPVKETPFVERETQDSINGKWMGHAVSYGAYREGQAPGVKGPSRKEILEDLTIVQKYWNLIRIYGSDDDAENILSVIRDNKLPIKVMLGVWLENEVKDPSHREANNKQALRAIELANKFKDQIFAVNVGNESQVFWSWHKMEMRNLIKYVRYVRNNTSVPVTVADDYNFWNKPESNQVADEIDFIVCHAYPLWNSQTLESSIPWLNGVWNDVKKLHSNKKLVLGEIGWATKYNASKTGPGEQGSLIKGKVGLDAQEIFLRKLYDWTNENHVITFWFEAFDEPWKGGGEQSGPDEIEKNWGVFYEDRTPKKSFTNFIESISQDTTTEK